MNTWTDRNTIADDIRRHYGTITSPTDGNRVLRDYGYPPLYREGTGDLTSVASVASFIAAFRQEAAL